MKWKGLLPSENSWITVDSQSPRNIKKEIENSQIVRLQRKLEIVSILGETTFEDEKYLLVEWNDLSTTFVTVSFVISYFPFVLLNCLCN